MKGPALKLILFLLLMTVAILVSYQPLRAVLRSTQHPEYYSHIPLIPFISAYLFLRNRKEIFEKQDTFYFPGLFIMIIGIVLVITGRAHQANANDYASITASAALIFASGSLLFVFDTGALRRGFFPLAFLIFAIPVPSLLMGRIVSGLVTASSGVSRVLFEALGIPFIQEGSVFHLPELSLEVSSECSGIRSSLALLITSTLVGHFFLRKVWHKTIIVLAVFPVAIFKNGLRIASLYLLSYFVDLRFIDGDFHHKFGGAVFFGAGLIVMGSIFWLLRKREKQSTKRLEGSRRQPDGF